MWFYLLLGLSTGLSAGISPGPLLALVVTASLRSGIAGGLRVALAPLITDAPIILLAVLVVRYLPASVLHWLGTLGGLVVIWMGVQTLRSARNGFVGHAAAEPGKPQQELWRGAVVNLLNPHPYLFWAAIGGPTLVRGWRSSPWHAIAFMVPFYLMLIGSKAAIAWLVGRQARGLSLHWYRRALTGSGLLVIAMGCLLIWQTWAA
jgi:threonine/homoserine/homoserine lactone efflux protein